MSTTCVRHRGRTSGSFNVPDYLALISKKAKPLREHNFGPQKPGRPTAPQGTLSPTASAPRDLEFAPSTSDCSIPRDVFGRRSDSSTTTTMTDTTTPETAADPLIDTPAYTPYTSRGGPEVYEKIARLHRGIATRTLRTLRFKTRVYNTHGVLPRVNILPSQNEVYEVYRGVSSRCRPWKISYTSKITPKCTKCTSAATSGGVVNV